MTITAYDQHGMLPVHAVRTASPLRLTLPEAVRATVDRAEPTLADSPLIGLDHFLLHVDGTGVRVFPRPAAAMPVSGAGEARDTEVNDRTGQNVTGQRHPHLILGALLATHGHGTDAIILNVNTTPLPLLESAMRTAQVDLHTVIVEARQRGEPARIGGERPVSDQTDIRFISSSPTWSFRIDVIVGPAHRSEWVVYQRQRRSWQEVQRLVIPE